MVSLIRVRGFSTHGTAAKAPLPRPLSLLAAEFQEKTKMEAKTLSLMNREGERREEIKREREWKREER